MRAPFAYYGGKQGLSKYLISLMPAHRVYMEPFFGSGAVFFAKDKVRHEIINDLDDVLVTFFKVLRERPDELESVCRLSPYSRTEWKRCEDLGGPDELEVARRFWVRVNQSFGKAIGHRTGWSVTTARTQSTAASVDRRISDFEKCAARLFGATIECCPATELIERLATADTLIYVDPPYLTSTRRGGRGGRASDYRRDMGDDESHQQLAEVLKTTPARVLISGYPSPLYDELYADWWYTDISVSVHSSNAATTPRTGRTERILANYEPSLGQFDFAETGA